MKTKELLRKLTDINVESCSTDRAYDLLLNVALEIGADDLIANFVNLKRLESCARNSIDHYGIGYVKYFLDGIDDFSHYIYYIDEGNARNVGVNDLKCLKYDLERRIGGLEK